MLFSYVPFDVTVMVLGCPDYLHSALVKISRAKLCIFQLIYISHHIEWNGFIRIGSQATMERTVGKMGHKIHFKKSLFANLANIIYEKN
jgi:hypothetical protein